MSGADTAPRLSRRPLSRLRKRWLMVLTLVMMALVIWGSHVYLTRLFSENYKTDAIRRATLYAGAIQSSMQRHAVVPLLLSRDPILRIALRSDQYEAAEERLAGFREEIGAGSIFLLDPVGRIVAASDERPREEYDSDKAYFTRAMSATGTEFSMITDGAGIHSFHYARRIIVEEETLGVVVVTVDLSAHEEGWRRSGTRIAVTDSEGEMLLASDPAWHNNRLEDLLQPESEASLVRGLLRSARSTIGEAPYTYLGETPFLRAEVPVGFRNWRLTFFSTLEDVRARVNGVLATIVMVLALLLALGVYILQRRTRAESRRFQRESAEQRAMNRRLSDEIAARRRLEKNLKEAEQSLEQASKLAALGQMSAAVSHELNQPLAAMKTYLAGARLLLQRKRPEEAVASIQRIDDLINRMGGITRQLKSYAQKGDLELELIDLRTSVRAALSLMAPQLAKTPIAITTTLPSERVLVRADPIRIEQILVNLLRNAVDAVQNQPDRQVKILLVEGETILLSVQDNGPGLREPDNLFEPFYTTKKPGEGLGLGLAISAGFAAEIGGRLVARNSEEGGAVFELVLPRDASQARAAE